jgi:hypothetical protein
VTALRVEAVGDAAAARAFHALPARLAPLGWSVPLRAEERLLFDPRRNGFLADHAVHRFIAWRGGRAVGRIAACIPQAGPGPASFGFLAAERDEAAVALLLGAARAAVAAAGRGHLDGPLSFTINHEVGALIAPPDRAPMLRMPRTPPWLPAMIEAAGFAPLGDVLACTLDLAAERHRARFAALAARRATEMARLRIRPLDRREYGAEVARVAALYDDAWAVNRHAVPLRPAEVGTLGRLLRPLLWRGEVFFAEWDGAPAGLLAIVPNIEPALPGDGRLLPFGWWPLLRALTGGAAEARIPMLGIGRALRGHPASALAMGALLEAGLGLAARRGWGRIEISWILEENAAMLNAMARLPAPETGRWRLWRGLTGGGLGRS